jgi:tetratricopeptide (TPR) repeat protein
MVELSEQVPSWATAVANLANALLERQSRTATPTEVLALIGRALTAMPADAPERARLHHVQGAAHWQEFLHSGDLSQLGSAIEAWQQAVALLPPGDAARPGYLNSVAIGLLQWHAHFADEPDLAAAVATARRAVRAAPPHSALAPIVWNALGHALAARYYRRGRRRDLDAAIDAWRRAVDLSSPRATVRPSYLASLANGLRERAARRTGKPATSDLLAAVALHREAIAALAGSQELPGQLANFGMSLHGLAAHTMNVASYLEASRIFEQAVELGLRMFPGEALRAALAWQAMTLDAVPDWPRAAMAGDGALQALWALSAGQLSRFAQETWLRTCIGVAGVTALAHAAASDLRAAVTTLESGRGLLVDRALPPGARLRAEHPELFARYQAASMAFAAALRTVVDPRGTARAPAQPLAGFSGLAGDSKR